MTTMKGRQDKFGSSLRLGALGLSALVLLGGCGWFGDSTPAGRPPPRPGLDRQVAPSSSLPAGSAGAQYEQGIVPIDDKSNTPQIGSIVPAKGGQKAQKEAVEKENVERDVKAREEREAARKSADEKKPGEQTVPVGAPASSGGEPANIPAAQPTAPQQPPVTTTTMPPPASGSPMPEPGQVSPVPPPSDKPS